MKKQKLPFFQRSYSMLSFVMVVATITLVGIVGFRFLDAQDNTEIATTTGQATQTRQVADINSSEDVEAVTEELDTAEIDQLDAELDQAFDF